MKSDNIPNHVAVVMDGNGRWASDRYMPRIAGHRKGVESLKRCVQACAARKIKVLTVFAFSSENWNRPEEEVSGLMDLMVVAIAREVPQLQRDGVRLYFVGDKSRISDRVKQGMNDAEVATASNTRMVLNVCFNYGGRWDIAQAANQLAVEGLEITETTISSRLALAHVPDPDLLVRTGNEIRISNFLIWQTAYCELYFSQTLWPDFDEIALDMALQEYGRRERRFGKTSQQIQSLIDKTASAI